MNTRLVAISELKLDKANVRKHDDKSIKAIADSLANFGQRKPIVIDKNNTVVAGNGTLQAGIFLGWKELECVDIPADWSDEKIKAFAIADNRTHDLSEFDDDILLDTLKSLNEFELEVTGFSQAELNDLIDDNKNPFKTIRMEVADLKAHPKNYQNHPDDQLEHIIASINTHGFYRNIVIAKDNVILAGHGVVQAVKKMGKTRVPVIKLDIESNSVKALKVLTSDNEINNLAQVDDEALTQLLTEILEIDSSLDGTGFNQDQLSALAFTSAPPDTRNENNPDDEWIGMTDWERYNEDDEYKLVIRFDDKEKKEELLGLIGADEGLKNFKKTTSIWWPPRPFEDPSSIVFMPDET
jgi:ParB-like chromosome segregation protein Spo0J